MPQQITSGGRASTDGVTPLKGASKNFTVHVLVASPFGGVSGREACDTTGENVIVAETRVRIPLGPHHRWVQGSPEDTAERDLHATDD